MAFNENPIEIIRHAGTPLIIFGAGVVGEAIFHACRAAGIEVECFCDNNVNKTRTPVCGKRVIHTPGLRKEYPAANILISAADIRDAVDQLHGLGYTQWYASSLLLREFEVYRYEYSAPAEFVEYAVSTCLLCHERFLTPEKLFMRSVDLIITERCSLKCRDCSNLMQYYSKPADCDTRELLRSIDVFSTLVDEVNEIRVIGGEPFMNKQHHIIMNRLVADPKIKKIVIYTNGTIVPNERQIEALKNKNVLILITDYGILSRRVEELKRTLQQNEIAFYAHKAGGWTDCARIGHHGRSIEQQKLLFKSCCAKNTISLSDGKLYRCPFSANVDRLRALPDHKEDHIRILHGPKELPDLDEVKKEIFHFLFQKEYLQTCDYCNGRPFDAPEITPAVQTDRPLEYKIWPATA